MSGFAGGFAAGEMGIPPGAAAREAGPECSTVLCRLPAVKSYASPRGCLHFEDGGKTFGLGVGLWVNRP